MPLLFYILAFFIVGIMLLAFAGNSLKVLGFQPAALAGISTNLQSRRAKHVYRSFYLLSCAFIKIIALLILGVLAVFAIRPDENENDASEARWHGGCLWHRDATGAWYSYSADDDTPSPPLF